MATRRQSVPAVEPTEEVAPLVEAATASLEVAVADVEPLTRFVVAENADLEVRVVLARSAVEQMPGWVAVEDVPDDAPVPQLPPTRPYVVSTAAAE